MQPEKPPDRYSLSSSTRAVTAMTGIVFAFSYWCPEQFKYSVAVRFRHLYIRQQQVISFVTVAG